MKNSIIDNSLKNSISITDKVNITNKREQKASQSKEQLENSLSNSIGDLSINGLLAKKVKQEIYSNKRKEARTKQKIKKNKIVEWLKKKYASSQELLNWIEISSSEIFI